MTTETPRSAEEPLDEKLEADRELKLVVPTDMKVNLYSLKVLTGRTISSIVEEALEAHCKDISALEGHDPEEGR